VIKDALYDNQVFECFQTALGRCKKSARAVGPSGGGVLQQENHKSVIEEFEQLMSQIHAQSHGMIEQSESAALSFHSNESQVELSHDDDCEDHDVIASAATNVKGK